jgi:hypothetical protein
MNASAENKESLEYYDLWKYYNGVGSRDKDRMITIVTWHLGTAVLIIGYMTTQLFEMGRVEAILLACLSVFICLVSIFWIYAFAGYANRCWNIADRCEEYIEGLYEFTKKRVFIDLLKDVRPERLCGHLDQTIMRRLLRMNHDPTKGLLPPYRILLLIAIFMIFVAVGVCILSMYVQKGTHYESDIDRQSGKCTIQSSITEACSTRWYQIDQYWDAGVRTAGDWRT